MNYGKSPIHNMKKALHTLWKEPYVHIQYRLKFSKSNSLLDSPYKLTVELTFEIIRTLEATSALAHKGHERDFIHVYTRKPNAAWHDLCVAACCRVLQSVAACCSVVQCFIQTKPECRMAQYAAAFGSVMQRAVVRCNVLQCVAVCCSVLQWVRRDSCISIIHTDELVESLCIHKFVSVYLGVHVRVRDSFCILIVHVWHHSVALPCSVLQCVAVCCSVLQCVAVCRSVLQCFAVCCSVLQCVAAQLHSLTCGQEWWLVHMYDMTRSHVRHDSSTCATWLVHSRVVKNVLGVFACHKEYPVTQTARKAFWNSEDLGVRAHPLDTSRWQPRLTYNWYTSKTHFSLEVMTQIKQKGDTGVETLLPRSFLGGYAQNCLFWQRVRLEYSYGKELASHTHLAKCTPGTLTCCNEWRK